MDNFFIEYRDPLFGILVFILIVIIVTVTNSFMIRIKKMNYKESLDSILSKFDKSESKELDLTTLEYQINIAKYYCYKNNYQLAISIYLKLLDNMSDDRNRMEILKEIAIIYLKSGFLAKSRNILVDLLKDNPKDIEILKTLLVVYEKLNDFNGAKDVADVLVTLGHNNEESYIEAQLIINSKDIDEKTKEKELISLLKKEPKLSKLLAQYFIEKNIDIFWENIDIFSSYNLIDIFWFLPKDKIKLDIINRNILLSDVMTIRNLVDSKDISSEAIFELRVLNSLKDREKATLVFEYICTSCNKVLPFYLNRCDSCQQIFSIKTKSIVVEDRSEKYISF